MTEKQVNTLGLMDGEPKKEGYFWAMYKWCDDDRELVVVESRKVSDDENEFEFYMTGNKYPIEDTWNLEFLCSAVPPSNVLWQEWPS
jgi:hypothetical protein